MRKIFIKNKDIDDGIVKIIGDDAHHIIHVLRLKPGANLLLSDGMLQYSALIDSINKSSVILKIINIHDEDVESPINITLYQGLPKSDKMDFIIQKCTEIGVKRFVPLETKYSLIKIKEKNIENKINRWQKISHEASKQSGRSVVPDVLMPIDFKESLKGICDYDLSIIPYEKEKRLGLKDILKEYKQAKNISVFIGPEGGFSDDEINTAIECGIKPVTLGPRILRTETAGIVTCSIILYELGDLG